MAKLRNVPAITVAAVMGIASMAAAVTIDTVTVGNAGNGGDVQSQGVFGPGSIAAAELLKKVRGPWEIENSLFFLKDRWWDKDRHWTRRPGVAEWLTQLTTAATTALRLLGSPDLPLRGRADETAWRPALGLALLGLA